MNTEQYNIAAWKIIEEQRLIIGPIALDLARKVPEITTVDGDGVKLEGDPRKALENLVNEYNKLFGAVAISTSKEALRRGNVTLSKEELPAILY